MTEATGVPVVVVPPSPAPIKPGYLTTEAWTTWIVIALGGLLSSGVIGDMSPLGKIIAFALSAVKAGIFTWSRTQVKTAATIFALLMMSNGTMACGPSARTQTIRATLIATNAAEHALIEFDQKMQENIVAGASDRESGAAMLGAWRRKRIEGQEVVIGAYRGIALAATLNDDASVQGMLSAFAILRQQLIAMGVTL